MGYGLFGCSTNQQPRFDLSLNIERSSTLSDGRRQQNRAGCLHHFPVLPRKQGRAALPILCPWR
jgi:hypothetical protein